MTGVFLSIEGPDGAGKTTLIKGLIAKLKDTVCVPIVLTREPGGERIAEEIREIILNPQNINLDVRAEALLYAASRSQHLQTKVQPALAKGYLVVSDRFVDSSIAYQGYGRQIGAEAIRAINDFATAGLTPNLTLYLDIDAETGLARIKTGRQNEQNRLDQESIDFHYRVVEGYRALLKEHPDRIVPIDATQSATAMQKEAFRIIRHRLPQLFEE